MVRLVFNDDNDLSQELELYMNDNGRIFIHIHNSEEDMYSASITLDGEDTLALAKELKKLASVL